MSTIEAMEKVNQEISKDDVLMSLYFHLEYPRSFIKYAEVEEDFESFLKIMSIHRLILEYRKMPAKDAVGEEIKKAVEEDSLKEIFSEFQSWAERFCKDTLEKKNPDRILEEYERHFSTDEGLELLLGYARKISKKCKDERNRTLFKNKHVKELADRAMKVT